MRRPAVALTVNEFSTAPSSISGISSPWSMQAVAASAASRMLDSIIILPLFCLPDMIFQVCMVQIYRFFRDGAYTDCGSGYHYSGNVSGNGLRYDKTD